ncbi:MAG: ABC transporter substrate-binding protein [Lachnospirales bacterium]
MKKFLKVILALATGVTLVSCSGLTNDEDIVLNTVSMLGGENKTAEYYEEILQNYESKYGIEVNDKSEGSSQEWKTSVRTGFQVGNIPDVLFYFTGAEAEEFITEEYFVDIKTIKSKYPEYGENISQNAMKFMIEDDGNAYALPVRGFWEGLILNTELFEEYDLELPTTWEKLVTAIEVFDENGVVPIAASLSEEPHYWIEHLILAYGGVKEHSKDLIQGEDAPESWAKALDLLVELNDMGAFDTNATTVSSVDAKNLFKEKKAAMILEGSWFVSGITDQENTTVISFPSYVTNKKESTDIIGGFSYGFYITREAWGNPEKREAAVKFVEEMTSNESIAKFATVGGAPAAEVKVLEGDSKALDDGVKMASRAENIEMPIDSRINKISWDYIVENIPSIIKGTQKSQDVLNSAADLNN